MNSKQFAWSYLIKNGFAGVVHSFYGGYEAIDGEMFAKYNRKWDWQLKALPEYRKMVKEIGVDWDKTKAPESDTVSLFTDTFHDPEQVEKLVGVLVLKNGRKINWVADALEVTNVFDMMEAVANAAADFEEIFGE